MRAGGRGIDAEELEIDLQNLVIDLQKLVIGLQKLVIDLQKLETDLQNLDVDLQKLETDLQNLETDLQKLEADLQNLEADLQKLDIDLQHLDIDLQNLEIDLQNLDVDLQNLEIDLRKLEIDLRKLAIDVQRGPVLAFLPMFDIIAFDADDTLWHNESTFQATEKQFADLLASYHEEELVRKRLFETELRNLRHFGYGVKGFTLSMIETAIELTNGEIRGSDIHKLVCWGRDMLQAPVELLEGARETIEVLSRNYRLMLLTKGDLFDQESKLARSGMGEHFSAVEIVSEKNVDTYRNVMRRHAVEPGKFLMIGNSLKSDVLPALEAGAAAIHVPYYTTWAHERVPEEMLAGRDFTRFESLKELPAWLRSGGAAGS